MPAPTPVLTPTTACELVGERCLAPDDDGRVGIELEWLPRSTADPRCFAPADIDGRAGTSVGDGASRLTMEPGGQVELSSRPLTLGRACEALASDAATLAAELADDGVALVGLGLDPGTLPERRLHAPRYDAMERYFDAHCPAGRTMMRATAALQVNLDAGGTEQEAQARWRRAQDAGPTLAAAFANSPLADGRPSGWRSRRLAVWAEVDRCSLASHRPADDPRAAYACYALDARVMLIRGDGDQFVPVLDALTFAEWIDRGHPLGYPTVDDLDYHLTTLFPPVRPRGWLELRMIDALPDPWWRVAVAVATAVVTDAAVAEAVAPTLAPTRGRWLDAARHAVRHPELGAAATQCVEATLGAVSRLDADPGTVAALEAFHSRFTAQGRCPADERLDEWTRSGALVPVPDRFVPA